MHLGANGNSIVRLPRRLNGRKNTVEKPRETPHPDTSRRTPAAIAAVGSHESFLKHVFGYGICTIILSIISFCWSFCSVLCILWFIQWSHVPPKSQFFPVPLDFEPFRLVQTQAEQQDPFSFSSIYTLRNAPSAISAALKRKPGNQGVDELPVNEDDDLMFKWVSNDAPSAVVGFADLELNVSGILNYSDDLLSQRSQYGSNLLVSLVSKPWDIAMRVSGLEKGQLTPSKFYSVRDFPIRIALAFEYASRFAIESKNEPGWRSWFMQTSSETINIRVTFYSGDGQPLLETATAFFPESKSSGFQEAARSTALSIIQLICVMLPIELQSFLMHFPNQWKPIKLTLLHRVTFASDKRSSISQRLSTTRFAKVKLTPKIPVKNCVLIFETLPTGLIAMLQDHPRILPVSLASLISTMIAVFVGLCAGTLSLICVVQRYLLHPKSQNL